MIFIAGKHASKVKSCTFNQATALGGLWFRLCKLPVTTAHPPQTLEPFTHASSFSNLKKKGESNQALHPMMSSSSIPIFRAKYSYSCIKLFSYESKRKFKSCTIAFTHHNQHLYQSKTQIPTILQTTLPIYIKYTIHLAYCTTQAYFENQSSSHYSLMKAA